MPYPWELMLVFLSGVLAGTLYFGGLMLTVGKLRSAGSPALLLLASFAFRAGLVLVFFMAVSRGQWQKYLACFLGFFLARGLAVQLFRPQQGRKDEVKAWKS
jgi:F1F0 ATPase subunit 2